MTVIVHSREELERLLITMHSEGWSIRKLAGYFSISRNTVRRILRKHAAARDTGHGAVCRQKQQPTLRESKLEPFLDRITELLKDFPKITGQRVYEEITAAGYDGGISILRARLRSLRPTPKKTPVIRFETEPGLQGQMDWSPYAIPFQRQGKITVNCFSYILGFSRRQYIDFTPRRDLFTLIRRHLDSFSHFNGSPRQCLYDNEKTVVLRWEAGRPVFNPSFASFITHYRCKPIACFPNRPQTKGKIERPFQYVENNLLGGRKFQDLDDLKACARWWLQNRSDTHIHDTTGRPPLELFLEEEQEALTMLPRCPYDASEVALRVCNIEGYLEFETNRYPIPYEYVTDILTVKATEQEIYVYSPELTLIVRHERLPAGAVITLDAAGIHGPRAVRYGLEPVRDQFLALGDDAELFLRGLTEQQPKNSGFHARAILRQKEAYHCDDIHRAISHACRYHAYDHRAVERILKIKAKPRTLESCRNERAAEHLRQALPPIKQRSLQEYSALLGDNNHEAGTDNGEHAADQKQLESSQTRHDSKDSR
nr:IS21 family transposase [uncultured Desulfobulbus sp.]